MIKALPLIPKVFEAGLKWKSKLNPSQRDLALKLADRLEKGDFSTGLIDDFKKINVPSFNFDTWLNIASKPQSYINKIVGQMISILRIEVPEKTASKRIAVGKKEFFVQVKDLPEVLQKALKKLKIRPSKIKIIGADSVSASEASSYGDGYQGFAVLVNLGTGEIGDEITSGWGMLVPDRNSRPLPMNAAMIVGQRGGSGGGASLSYIKINPDNVTGILPMPEIELSNYEKKALMIIKQYNTKGRKDEFQEQGLGMYGPSNQHVKSLIEKGFVAVKGAGIVLTIQGQNLALTIPSSVLFSREARLRKAKLTGWVKKKKEQLKELQEESKDYDDRQWRAEKLKRKPEGPSLQERRKQTRGGEDEDFQKHIKGKTYTNPETGNKVKFKSLPGDEQAKIYSEWKKSQEKTEKKASLLIKANTPSWPGADEVYSYLYKVLEKMGAENWKVEVERAKKIRRKPKFQPSEEMADLISALGVGDEEVLKDFHLKYKTRRFV